MFRVRIKVRFKIRIRFGVRVMLRVRIRVKDKVMVEMLCRIRFAVLSNWRGTDTNLSMYGTGKYEVFLTDKEQDIVSAHGVMGHRINPSWCI